MCQRHLRGAAQLGHRLSPLFYLAMRLAIFALWTTFLCSGCAVVAVADATVAVVATTVKVGAAVVGTTVNVGAAGVRALTGSNGDD